MNKKMGLKSIVRRRKPGYTKRHPYKLFRNILEQDFTCDEINTKWCTDFTYLYLSDGNLLTQRTIIEDLILTITIKSPLKHEKQHAAI